MKRSSGRSKLGRLVASFYLDEPAFAPAVLDPLHDFLRRWLSVWQDRLRIARNEDDRNPTPVRGDEPLVGVVARGTPLRLGVGSAVLLGTYEGLTVTLWAARTAKTLGQNRLVLEILHRDEIEGKAPEAWLRNAFAELARLLPARYGKGHCAEEFERKNIVSDSEGTRSVGINLRKYFPGLYWLNYFGSDEVNRIGRERLLSAPAHEVLPVDGGIVLTLGGSSAEWESQAYIDREANVIEHLGSSHFFERSSGVETEI